MTARVVSTPRDWVRELTERAREGRLELTSEEALRLALTLSGLAATVEQLESYVHQLHELRPSPSYEAASGWRHE